MNIRLGNWVIIFHNIRSFLLKRKNHTDFQLTTKMTGLWINEGIKKGSLLRWLWTIRKGSLTRISKPAKLTYFSRYSFTLSKSYREKIIGNSKTTVFWVKKKSIFFYCTLENSSMGGNQDFALNTDKNNTKIYTWRKKNIVIKKVWGRGIQRHPQFVTYVKNMIFNPFLLFDR